MANPLSSLFAKDEPFSSKILKVVFLLGIILIIIIVILAALSEEFNILQILTYAIGGIIGIFILMFAIKGLQMLIAPKPFSPQDSFKKKLIYLAKKGKPFNVKNLYLRGEDMRTHAKWGRIIGLGFIPYFASKIVRDKEGKIVFETEKAKNEKGQIVEKIRYKEAKKDDGTIIYLPVPKKETTFENDGDIVFVVPKSKIPFFWRFFGGFDIIRANPKFCSDQLGDIFIKDVNFFPIGDYLYPAKQCKSDIVRIQAQDQTETILQTHKNFLDLVSWVTQMSLGSDPTFQKIMVANSESLQRGGFVQQQQ